MATYLHAFASTKREAGNWHHFYTRNAPCCDACLLCRDKGADCCEPVTQQSKLVVYTIVCKNAFKAGLADLRIRVLHSTVQLPLQYLRSRAENLRMSWDLLSLQGRDGSGGSGDGDHERNDII